MNFNLLENIKQFFLGILYAVTFMITVPIMFYRIYIYIKKISL